VIVSCISHAPAMLVLTIIISARSWARSKVFPSAGRRSAVCSARTVLAPPRNGARPRTANDDFAALARAKCSS
jgi:hypothetical protein